MHVAVTGASGVVGRFVVAELHARGARVRAWARPSTDRRGFAGPVEWIPGDLRAPASAADLVAGADALVHCALDHTPGRYRGGEGADLDAWLDANVGGSLRLMTAARRAGVGRFVFISSRAAYGDARPEPTLREHDEARPDTHYGAAKRAVEAFVQSYGLGEGWHASALRATGVYGVTWPLARTKWLPLVRAVLAGEAWPGRGGGTEVHGADLARAVWALLTHEGTAGQIYNCSDAYVTERDVAEIAQRHAGVRGALPAAPVAPPLRVPDGARLAALGVTLGGRQRLHDTVAQLVDAVRAEAR